jgi:hypothetical protein
MRFAPCPLAVAVLAVSAPVGRLKLREAEQFAEFVVGFGEAFVMADQRLCRRMRLRAVEAGGVHVSGQQQAEHGQ